MSKDIEDTLKERGTRYGKFIDQSHIVQGIKDAMTNGQNWNLLADDMKECLEQVAGKISRILNGDPHYIDNWHDIIGYTRLVEQRLEEEQEKEKDANTPTSNEWRNECDIESVLANPVVNRGIPDLSPNILPSDLTGWWFRGYDGVYEYWQSPDGGVARYDTQSSGRMQGPTVSELFPSGGGTFNSLYDLTQRDSGGTLSLAIGDRDGGSSGPDESTELRIHNDR